MASPNTLSKELNDLLTTTLEVYRETMEDNIFRSNVTLAKLQDRGAINEQDGGNRIMVPLMYGTNDTVQSYSGYDQLSTQPQETMSSAEYFWKNLACTVTISREERRKNSGRSQLFNLLDRKLQNAEMSLEETLNSQMINSFSAANGGKDITPIHELIQKDPSSGVVGGIDPANFDFWRNRALSSAATDAEGLKKELYRVYNLSKRGTGGPPDLLLTDQITFEEYEDALDQRQRYIDTEVADLGFDAMRVKGAAIAWEENFPDIENQTVFDETLAPDFDPETNPSTGGVLFLNTDFIEVIVDSQTRFVTGDFIEPHNQVAAVAKILFMGNLVLSNRRKQGVLYNISRPF